MPRCSNCGRLKFSWHLENGLCRKCIDKSKQEREAKEADRAMDLMMQQERERLLLLQLEESQRPSLDETIVTSYLVSEATKQTALVHANKEQRENSHEL